MEWGYFTILIIHLVIRILFIDGGIGSRSYMSKDLFAYLAYRVGFEIVEQHVIDWE